jgi:phosphoserine phosphatase RsbU/P
MSAHTLASIPLFSSLPLEEIRFLETSLASVSLPAGRILFHEGHVDDKSYILLDGEVEVVKMLGKPEERPLARCTAGILLGEMSLFSRDGRHTASVRSLTPLRLLKLTHAELASLLHRQPQLTYEIIRLLSRRLEESEDVTILDLREKNQRLTQAYQELKAAQDQLIEKERLEKELEIARQIQQSILPDTLPHPQGYEFGACMIPARAVGGDFYTFFDMPHHRLGIVVGDVSDKGVPASLFMALTYSLIRAEAVRTQSPVQACQKVNQHLLQMNSSSMFVTLVYGILDCDSGDFHYARAAHPVPFLMDEDGLPAALPVLPAQPLGLFETLPLDEQHLNLQPGATLVLYSDGITETMDAAGVEFGSFGLTRTLQSERHLPAQHICERLYADVQAHGGSQPQHDDFTIVTIKRQAGQ